MNQTYEGLTEKDLNEILTPNAEATLYMQGNEKRQGWIFRAQYWQNQNGLPVFILGFMDEERGYCRVPMFSVESITVAGTNYYIYALIQNRATKEKFFLTYKGNRKWHFVSCRDEREFDVDEEVVVRGYRYLGLYESH